ncbi:hypothetical protein Tco_0405253 [Tanacetum coccineum]
MPTEMELTLETNPKGVSYEVSAENRGLNTYAVRTSGVCADLSRHGPVYAMHKPLPASQRVNLFTMKMEILLESTSNKLMVDHYLAEIHFKKILLKLNLSDHKSILTDSKIANIIAFQEWYEHVGPEVASPQDGKVTRWRRDCAWLMISRCSRSQCQIQVQGTSSIQEVNDHYNIFTRESQEYELKTKDKA